MPFKEGKAPADEDAESKEQEEKVPYGSAGDLVTKVRLLGSDPKIILPEKLLEIINRKHSASDWSQLLEAKETARQLMSTWAEQEARKRGIVWIGDWKKGERPEGYIDVKDRYEKLHEKGFSATERLGETWVKKNNLLLDHAEKGLLKETEAEVLLQKNKELNEQMDRFERGTVK